MVGVGGNAFIIRSQFRDLRSSLGKHLDEFGTDLKAGMNEIKTDLKANMDEIKTDLKADMNEIKTDLRTYRRTLEDSMPAYVKDASAVENEHLGLVRLSRAMCLLSKQEAEHTITQKDAGC